MTQKLQGTLTTIKARSGTNARGKWTAYSIAIDTGAKDWSWIRYGFDAPSVKEGSPVTIEVEDDGNGNLVAVKGTLAVDKSAPPKAASGSRKSDDVQDSIVRQNATATAARVLRDMVDLGVLSIPKSKAQAYDAYLGYLEEITNHIFLANRNAKSVEDLLSASSDEQSVAGDEEMETDDEVWPEVG